MKVVLLDNIKGVGQRFDVKNVSDGYARNYLLPKNLAKVATPAAIQELEEQKALAERERTEFRERLEGLKKLLKKEPLTFSVKVGKDGSVFSSVSRDDIQRALLERGFEKTNVLLPKSIKTTGETEVEIEFSHGIKGVIPVLVKVEGEDV